LPPSVKFNCGAWIRHPLAVADQRALARIPSKANAGASPLPSAGMTGLVARNRAAGTFAWTVPWLIRLSRGRVRPVSKLYAVSQVLVLRAAQNGYLFNAEQLARVIQCNCPSQTNSTTLVVVAVSTRRLTADR